MVILIRKRQAYCADPGKKKVAVRAAFYADPEKKKAAVKALCHANPEQSVQLLVLLIKPILKP